MSDPIYPIILSRLLICIEQVLAHVTYLSLLNIKVSTKKCPINPHQYSYNCTTEDCNQRPSIQLPVESSNNRNELEKTCSIGIYQFRVIILTGPQLLYIITVMLAYYMSLS